MKKHILFLEMLIPFIAAVPLLHAQVMTSTNYQIQSDSVNVGGVRSTSTSFILEDTVGELATGVGTSTNYELHAGYQQMQEVYIALAGGDNVTLSPSLGGVTGGTSNGSTTLTATTDSSSGYQLTIKASSSPAMQSDVSSITDYTPAGGAPDYTFLTGSTDSHLGFSPEGDDIPDRFLDDTAGSCNTGATDSSLTCWDGLSTSETTIAERTTANHPNGTDTAINFRVGIGDSVGQVEGVYIATTTVTLLPL